MTLADDRILAILDSADIALTPAVIAFNIRYSRSHVNDRIRELNQEGLVTKVDNDGYYLITDLGRSYLQGDIKGSALENEE